MNTAPEPERLTRWRVWAQRFDPNRPDWRLERDRHLYTANCPWCRADHYRTDPLGTEWGRDGNAHDNALILLDHIAQLEARVTMLETMLGGVLA